jgi:signal peptidase II
VPSIVSAGAGNAKRRLVATIAVAVVAVVAVDAATKAIAAHALGLLLGGGVGNLLDRLLSAPGPLRGGVIDWIKPTLSSGSLNIADLSINAAVVAVLIGLALDWQRRLRPGADGMLTEPDTDPPSPA